MKNTLNTEQLTLLLAAVLSLFLALIPPLVIHVGGVKSEHANLVVKTEIHAQSITELVNRNPELWQTMTVGLEQILRHRSADGVPEVRTVRNLQGDTVATHTEPLDGPFYFTASEKIYDAGQAVGQLTITRSQTPLLLETLTVFLISLVLALGFYLFLKLKPLADLRRSQQALENLAMNDGLTGLLNRFAFHQRSEQMLLMAARPQEKVAVLFMDLNKFKQVNDTLGHEAGDELLIEVAHRLRASVRECDILARLGGDEFIVVITGVEGQSAVGVVAEKITTKLCEPFLLGGKTLNASVSIGIAISPADGRSLAELRIHADLAMYHAKELGAGNYQFFTAEMNQFNLNRIALKQDMKDALERDEFVLHYQPQVHVQSGQVCGVEALVRWQHPVKGLVPPISFIAAAEENGLILPLGDWVLNAACRQLRQWLDAGLTGFSMSVNVSPRQFEADTFLSKVQEALTQYDLPPAMIELEITEGVMFKNPRKAIEQMRQLRAMGVQLSIDDFGTGYSSLSYLRELPVTRLKLDKSLVQNIASDSGTLAICKATIRLSADLGLDVVAEGVESPEQVHILKRIRCPVVQGYYFSKPLPADALVRFVMQNQAKSTFWPVQDQAHSHGKTRAITEEAKGHSMLRATG